MKLQKNNKYKGKMALGLATVMLSGILMSGCNRTNTIVTEEPVATVEVTSTPTPTPISTPAPIPELSYDEEIALLKIKEPQQFRSLESVSVLEYIENGNIKVIFTSINALANEEGGHDVYECFTNEKLFSFNYDIYLPENNTPLNMNIDNITVINENLKDVEILRGYCLYTNSQKLKDIGIILKEEDIDLLNDDILFFNTEITNTEVADIYLSIIPKAYRVTADELINTQNKVLVK